MKPTTKKVKKIRVMKPATILWRCLRFADKNQLLFVRRKTPELGAGFVLDLKKRRIVADHVAGVVDFANRYGLMKSNEVMEQLPEEEE